MRLVALALVACFLADSPALAEARGGAVEAIIRVPGLDVERFVADLARRTRLRLVLVAEAEARGARLELGFDRAKGTARVAYHDGESEAPALVVVAQFSSGGEPSVAWFLTQAESAIQSFDHCEGDLQGAGLAEVLDPWSPGNSRTRQRWAEVLDPWLGCLGKSGLVRPAGPEWPGDLGEMILEGEVLDPWLEAAYEERAVALSPPRPGMPPREMTRKQSER